MAKRKNTIKRKLLKRKKQRKSGGYKVSQVKEDTKQRRKYERGGRIEAYTWGEMI